MSNARYIEIDSTFRNRSLWENPSEFEIPISQSGTNCTKDTAENPVSNMYPVKAWTGNQFQVNNLGAPGTCISGTAAINVPGGGAVGTPSHFVMEATFLPTVTLFQQESDYYSFAIIKKGTGATSETRLIAATTYIGIMGASNADHMRITLQLPFSSLIDGDALVICDPSEFAVAQGGIAFSNPMIFLPAGDLNPNIYTGRLLYNETRRESREILGYSAITHLITLVTNESPVQTTIAGPVNTWLFGDNYSVRRQVPVIFDNTGGNTNQTIVLSAAQNPNTEQDFYKNQFIRVQAGTITPADRYNTEVYLPPPSPPPYFRPGIPPIGEIRRIISSERFPPAVGLNVRLTLDRSFSVAPNNVDMDFEILMFSGNSFSPFNYSGSLTSQQEMVCYEIELLNLVLPNQNLIVQQGGRIAFYPYIYVELSNVSSAIGSARNAIYSNNPHATAMTFRAAVDDVPNPVISTFVKIDGDGMVQTLKFKPNDNLKFAVRMSNGELYRTVVPERPLPGEPEPRIQISACFSVRRL